MHAILMALKQMVQMVGEEKRREEKRREEKRREEKRREEKRREVALALSGFEPPTQPSQCNSLLLRGIYC